MSDDLANAMALAEAGLVVGAAIRACSVRHEHELCAACATEMLAASKGGEHERGRLTGLMAAAFHVQEVSDLSARMAAPFCAIATQTCEEIHERIFAANPELQEIVDAAAGPEPDEPEEDESPPPARCLDCGLPYSCFPLDVTLPDDQWLAIHPEGFNGLLCAQCIVARASKLPGACAVRAVIDVPSPAAPPSVPEPTCAERGHPRAYDKLDMAQSPDAPLGTTTPTCACGVPCGPTRPRGETR